MYRTVVFFLLRCRYTGKRDGVSQEGVVSDVDRLQLVQVWFSTHLSTHTLKHGKGAFAEAIVTQYQLLQRTILHTELRPPRKGVVAHLQRLQFRTVTHFKHAATSAQTAVRSNTHRFELLEATQSQAREVAKTGVADVETDKIRIDTQLPFLEGSVVALGGQDLDGFVLRRIVQNVGQSVDAQRGGLWSRSNRDRIDGLANLLHNLPNVRGVSVLLDARHALLHERVLRLNPPKKPHVDQLVHAPSLLHLLHQALAHKVHKGVGPPSGESGRWPSELCLSDARHIQTLVGVLPVCHLDQ